MKNRSILQLIIIIIGIFIGAYFSNKAALSHQKNENDTSITHMNHGNLEISQDTVIPMLEEVIVTKDVMKGWNVFIKTTDFTFTPEHVNKEHKEGEGHAHLYINEKKYARLYSPSFHIPDITGNKNEIKITLNANNHKTLILNGKPIEKRIKLN